jgi:hypothetical protein
MDEADRPVTPDTTVSAVPAGENLSQEIESLRSTTTIALLALACIAASLSIYLYRQVTVMNRQVSDGKRVVNEFQSNTLPQIRWFVENLQAFSKTNPDFTPVLAKYGLVPGAPVPGRVGTNAAGLVPPGK